MAKPRKGNLAVKDDDPYELTGPVRKLWVELDRFCHALPGVPGVFMTEQWGGWAYKIPGKGGNRLKPKLVAYVEKGRGERAGGLEVQFKLPEEMATQVVEEYEWVVTHPWPSLGGAGWVLARLKERGQWKVLGELLRAARGRLPMEVVEKKETEQTLSRKRRGESAGQSEVARRIETVTQAMKEAGWRHRDDWAGDAGQRRVSKSGPRRRRRGATRP